MSKQIHVGDMVEIGAGTAWGGMFKVLQVVKVFKNGKVAVKVDFHGKPKVFNMD